MNVSKWKQYKILRTDKRIVPFLPKTAPLTEKRLWQMIEENGEVIIKPKNGRMGQKVIKLSLMENEQFEIHSRDKIVTLNGRKETFDYLLAHHLASGFIVQQSVPLATVNGCPFDLRVIVQRTINSSTWVVTGTLARVAYEGYFITSVTNHIIPVEKAIQTSCLQGGSLNSLLCEINHVVLLVADRFLEKYPSCHLIGIDIGIDEHGQIWIIDSNFNPMLSIFKWLEDQSMYKRIKSFL